MICEAALKLKEAKQPVICEAALKLKEALQRDRPTFAVAFSTFSLQLRYLQSVKHTSATHNGAENSAGSSSLQCHSCLHVYATQESPLEVLPTEPCQNRTRLTCQQAPPGCSG